MRLDRKIGYGQMNKTYHMNRGVEVPRDHWGQKGQMWETMCYGYHIWSGEPLMQAKDDDDLCGGQRSTEVKYSEQCSVATKLGQENR